MKKILKVFAIAGVVCLIAGTGISITAFALGARIKEHSIFPHRYFTQGRFITEMIFDETGTERYEYSFKDVASLSLNLDAAYAEIITEDDGEEIKVSFEGEPKDHYQYEMDGNKLNIEWTGYIKNKPTDTIRRKVRIVVPKGVAFEDVEFDLSATELSAEELNTGKLDADIKASTITIDNGSVKTLDADIKAGEMTFQGLVQNDVSVDCKAGSMDLGLTGKETDYNYDIGCQMGEIKIGTATYTGMIFERTMDNHAQKQIELDCKTGEINVWFRE